MIEGATVAADILSLSGATSTATAGVSFQLSVKDISTTTDVNGQFTITLPADSTVNLLTENWGLDSDGVAPVDAADTDSFASTNVIVAGQTTNNEQITQNIGIIQVCPFVTPDTTIPNTPPMFSSIDGQTTLMVDATFDDTATSGDTATFVGLKEGVVNNFAINFSEALPNMTTEDVRVYLGEPEIVQAPSTYTVVLNDAKDGLVLTFNEDLEPGSKVEVSIAQWLAEDADGADFVDNDSFEWDSVSVDPLRITDLAAAKALYASARFCTFKKADPLDAEASITLIEQIIDADTTEDGGVSALADYSSVFADNLDGGLGIDQLNSDEPTTVAARLASLASAIETANGGVASALVFDLNQAEVTYEDATGVVTVASTVGTPAPAAGLSGDGSITVTDTADSAVVTATAKNVFGDTIATSSVTVTDQIAPTTVLQESYNINDDTVTTPLLNANGPKAGQFLVATGGSAAVQFGDGGEVTGSQGAVVATVGNPIIYVQPRHLVGRNAGLSAAVRGSEFDALTADMASRLTTGEAGTLAVINGRPAYDATAYDAWGAISQNIGVAVSEDVTVVAGAALGTANISTAITSPTALIDTAANVDGVNVVDVDLVQVTVADVVALANTDHGGTLSLSGVIQDTAGTPNVANAASNAQVVLEDAFPPMVMDARWDGTTVSIQFNEAIELPTATAGTNEYGATSVNMHLVHPVTDAAIAITLDGTVTSSTAANYFSWNATTNTLTVNNTAVSAGWAGNGTAAQDEFLYNDDLISDADEEQHALLIWDNILDTNGNRWADFHGHDGIVNAVNTVTVDGDADLSDNDLERWEVNAPQFWAVNELGQFNISWAWSGVIDGADVDTMDDDGIAQVTVKFSHPLDISLLDDNSDNIIQEGELLDLFAIDLDGVAGGEKTLDDVASNRSISISADNKTVTINLAEAVNAGIDVGTSIIIVGDTGIDAIGETAESALTVETAESTLTLTATTN